MSDSCNISYALTSTPTVPKMIQSSTTNNDDEPRKPYYRDLEKTTLQHVELRQDDVIFVEALNKCHSRRGHGLFPEPKS